MRSKLPIFTEEQAKAMLIERYYCDHCGALHSTRRRSLNSTMVKQLVALYRYFKHPSTYSNLQFHRDDTSGHWLHASRYLTYSQLERECLKLRHWGFIEPHFQEKEDGNPWNGYVRMTDKGRMFCQRKIKAFSHILTKNQQGPCIGYTGTMIDIIEAGGNDFDYNKEIRS